MKAKLMGKLTSILLAFVLLMGYMPSFGAARAEDTVNTFTLTAGIKENADDSEEWLSGANTGLIDYNSSDLEIGWEKPAEADPLAQIIAVRFAELNIPKGARITGAYIQFTADIDKDAGASSKSANPFDIYICAEDTADSAPIQNVQYNISSRTKTTAYVSWYLNDGASRWTTPYQREAIQRTPDIAPLLQYIIDKDGWASGNAVCFLLSGSWNRTAASSEDAPDRSTGPSLCVTFEYAGNLDQAAPTGLSGTAPTSAANNDGSITGVTSAMEYKPMAAASWTACTGTAINGLAAGIYEVRYAARTGYNASPSTNVTVPPYAGYDAKDITLQPGSDETKMNFCWYSPSATTACCVQIAQKAAMTGSEFPAAAASSFTGTVTRSGGGSFNSNKVTVSGLQQNTEYVYRLGDGTNFSGVYSFRTDDLDDGYTAIFVGDPQIGCSNTTTDAAGWQNTLTKALGSFPEASFIISAGDQVETSTNETQYDGFFTPAALRSYPLVPVVGNHDNSALYKYHYNSPNESASYGTTNAGGDYWFTYGSSLYMVLNTNNQSSASHEAFIGEAIAAAGSGIKWKIVVMHHSIYSSASHSTDSDIAARRSGLYPVFDKYDIDVVLAGHDHCYTRTYQMLGGVAQQNQKYDTQSRVVNPTGTLYITSNSASGSKYYDFKAADTAYMAVRWQGYTPSYSKVTVTDETFTITTYRSDSNEVIDTYTIYKNEDFATAALKALAPYAILDSGRSLKYRVTVNNLKDADVIEGIVSIDDAKFQITDIQPLYTDSNSIFTANCDYANDGSHKKAYFSLAKVGGLGQAESLPLADITVKLVGEKTGSSICSLNMNLQALDMYKGDNTGNTSKLVYSEIEGGGTAESLVSALAGDINGDTVLNGADLSQALTYFALKRADSEQIWKDKGAWRTDYDCNGSIDVGDLTKTAMLIARLG